MSALSRLRRYFSFRPEPPRPTDDQWSLAKQGAGRLTTDELHAIGAIARDLVGWAGLLEFCYNTGLDRPFALD